MKILLFIFSLLLRLGCLIKNRLYEWKIFKPKRAPLPVISIGNITFGGTEKTPLVMDLLSFLIKQGLRSALISRGYKGRWEKKGGILSEGKGIFGSWKESGDEPFMVAQNIPQAGVFIGRNRLLSCQKAEELGFRVAILDDGFQHRRLFRNLDIVLHNPQEKICLREPLSSLRRTHILLLKKQSKTSPSTKIKDFLSKIEIFEYSVQNKGFSKINSEETIPSEGFRGKRILAFCGIAQPQRFFSLLQEGGMDIAYFFQFSDHFPYPSSSLEKIAKKYREIKPCAAITTEKDAAKIFQNRRFLEQIPIYYLRIGLRLEEKFYERMKAFLQDIV